MRLKWIGLLLATFVVANLGGAMAQDATDATVVLIREDQVALEFVGQFNNTPTTSQQFGYVSKLAGLDSIFTGTPNNESTALFTFVTNATTDRVIANGALRIINRTGTTTVYLNTPPSDFTNPASFSQGTPILVASYTQQVVNDTLSGAFTTVHINTITSNAPFSLNGQTFRLGQVGKSFRTNYSGHANPLGAAPTGWFGGYAVGVKK